MIGHGHSHDHELKAERLVEIGQQMDALEVEVADLLADDQDEVGSILCPYHVGETVVYDFGGNPEIYQIIRIFTHYGRPWYSIQGHKLTKAGELSGQRGAKQWLKTDYVTRPGEPSHWDKIREEHRKEGKEQP